MSEYTNNLNLPFSALLWRWSNLEEEKRGKGEGGARGGDGAVKTSQLDWKISREWLN